RRCTQRKHKLRPTSRTGPAEDSMTPTADAPKPPAPKREWAPHIWEGCDFFAWMRLLSHNRFAVHFRLLYVAVVVTVVSIFHTLLRWLQNELYGTRLERTPL